MQNQHRVPKTVNMCLHPNPPPNPSPDRFRPAADNTALHVDKILSLAETSTMFPRTVSGSVSAPIVVSTTPSKSTVVSTVCGRISGVGSFDGVGDRYDGSPVMLVDVVPSVAWLVVVTGLMPASSTRTNGDLVLSSRLVLTAIRHVARMIIMATLVAKSQHDTRPRLGCRGCRIVIVAGAILRNSAVTQHCCVL